MNDRIEFSVPDPTSPDGRDNTRELVHKSKDRWLYKGRANCPACGTRHKFAMLVTLSKACVKDLRSGVKSVTDLPQADWNAAVKKQTGCPSCLGSALPTQDIGKKFL